MIGDPAARKSFLDEIPEHARTLELARAWLGEPACPAAGEPWMRSASTPAIRA